MGDTPLIDPTLEQFQAWYDSQSIAMQEAIATAVDVLRFTGKSTKEACIFCYHEVRKAQQDRMGDGPVH